MRTIHFLFTIALIFSYTFCAAQNEAPKEEPEPTQSVFYIKEDLQDGKGDFDPRNIERWEGWYNERGELMRQFDVDTSVKFKLRKEPWLVKISDQFTNKSLFTISKQGVAMDGNWLVITARTKNKSLPLGELYALRKEPWTEGSELMGIFITYHN